MLIVRSSLNVHRLRLHAVACIAILVTVVMSSDFAAAQGGKSYTWETIDAPYKNRTYVNSQKATKQGVLLGQTAMGSKQQAFDNWYRKYLFRQMASKDQLGSIPPLRESLKKDLRFIRDANVHQYLVNMVFNEATRLASEKYHPVVRYNALLVLGDLNLTEERIDSGLRYPPVRLPKALDFLIAEFKKPNQQDAIMLGAMIGIRRHVFLNRQREQVQPISDTQKEEIKSLMLTLVQQKDTPAGRSEDGHAWLRQTAIDILADLGDVGTNQIVLNAVIGVVDDSDAALSLRCRAARALKNFDYTDVSGLDAVAVAQKLGALAVDACRTEDARVKEQLKNSRKSKPSTTGADMLGGMGAMDGLRGGGGGRGMGAPPSVAPGMMSGGLDMGMGDDMASAFGGTSKKEDDEPDEDIQDARKLLKKPLHYVLLGLRGDPPKSIRIGQGTQDEANAVLRLAADDQQKAEIQNIVKALDALIEATDNYDDGLEEMMKQVRAKTDELVALLPKPDVAKPAAPAADAGPGVNLPGAAPAPPTETKTPAPAPAAKQPAAAAPAGKTPAAPAGQPAGKKAAK